MKSLLGFHEGFRPWPPHAYERCLDVKYESTPSIGFQISIRLGGEKYDRLSWSGWNCLMGAGGHNIWDVLPLILRLWEGVDMGMISNRENIGMMPDLCVCIGCGYYNVHQQALRLTTAISELFQN